MSQNRYKGITFKVQRFFFKFKTSTRRFRNKYKYNSQIHTGGERVGLETKIWIKSSRLEEKPESYILYLIGFLITPRKQNEWTEFYREISKSKSHTERIFNNFKSWSKVNKSRPNTLQCLPTSPHSPPPPFITPKHFQRVLFTKNIPWSLNIILQEVCVAEICETHWTPPSNNFHQRLILNRYTK